MTTTQAYNDFQNQLKKIYDERESENISDWVFENVTGQKRWERRNNPNELKEAYFNQLQNYLQQLLVQKPVQYVLNEAWFYKMKFFVNENVLIPRPETEELVEWIIKNVRRTTYDVRCTILDIGTGSGCIPVSLKRELHNTNVTAIDVSEKALQVAKKNAESLNAKIDFLKIDFLNENNWKALPQFDIIVSNPPYIPFQEKEKLAKNVTAFEPGIALFVENKNPFIFYKKISAFAKSHLKQNGKIYVEVHEEYAENIKTIFENAGFISEIKKDIYGKERMVRATFIEN
ncbi:MAG TPA: peptide chain release factor N(5)-glutamine methyltransferase [Hanamia sp.]|jgi:protein-(glutamine-N5) methyltransferase, release factor-specific